MHTCEIIVRNCGESLEDLCGKPAVKSVVRHTHASGAPCKPGEEYLVWLCDEHYDWASLNWTGVCEF